MQDLAMRMMEEFSDRAEEYVRLAQRAKTPHDQELLLEFARAWHGLVEGRDQIGIPEQKH